MVVLAIASKKLTCQWLYLLTVKDLCKVDVKELKMSRLHGSCQFSISKTKVFFPPGKITHELDWSHIL